MSMVIGRLISLMNPDRGSFSLSDLLNGILGGAVAVTSPCGLVEPWAAVIIGFVSAFFFNAFSWTMLRLRIDDPVDAVAVHMGCGIWGLISSGLFATEQYVTDVYGVSHTEYGLFLGGGYRRIIMQLVGAICIIVWTCCWSLVLMTGIVLTDHLVYEKFQFRPFLVKERATEEKLAFGVEAKQKAQPTAFIIPSLPLDQEMEPMGGAKGSARKSSPKKKKEEEEDEKKEGSAKKSPKKNEEDNNKKAGKTSTTSTNKKKKKKNQKTDKEAENGDENERTDSTKSGNDKDDGEEDEGSDFY